jgi:hypothetical protein
MRNCIAVQSVGTASRQALSAEVENICDVLAPFSMVRGFSAIDGVPVSALCDPVRNQVSVQQLADLIVCDRVRGHRRGCRDLLLTLTDGSGHL